MSVGARLALIAILAFLTWALVNRAEAQTLSPWDQRLDGWMALLKQNGKLPDWATLDDEYTVAFAADRLRGSLCVVDKVTRQKWVLHGDVRRARQMIMGVTEAWLTSLKIPNELPDPELVALCQPFFAQFPPVTPTALGVPRYRATVVNAGTVTLDWEMMNTNWVMGSTLAGDPCLGTKLPMISDSSDAKVGWYNHPAGGFTRCREP